MGVGALSPGLGQLEPFRLVELGLSPAYPHSLQPEKNPSPLHQTITPRQQLQAVTIRLHSDLLPDGVQRFSSTLASQLSHKMVHQPAWDAHTGRAVQMPPALPSVGLMYTFV